MTARELSELLSTFPPDAPVIAEWEGTWNTIVKDGVTLYRAKNGRDVVILDVDGGGARGQSDRVFDDEGEDFEP